jgi:adenylyltransferase/sulfurtransferase
MQTIDVFQLKELIDTKSDFQLIDVREVTEFETCNLNGELIPLGELPHRTSEVSKDKMVVVHCRSGMRSANAIAFLQETEGYSNLYNLTGGILAWAKEIDPTMPSY